ncbi:hypothetical protein [Kitasatospora purpeofusca]|uniref:hypothetical protein n=1 Tax=Kitasatospora purpeofusca TaxID=67352 RepID=UPI0036D38ABF
MTEADNAEIVIGDWTISEDSNGNLTFRNESGKSLAITPQGGLEGNLENLVKYDDRVQIYNHNNWGKHALGWGKAGDTSHDDDWDTWAYWLTPGNHRKETSYSIEKS